MSSAASGSGSAHASAITQNRVDEGWRPQVPPGHTQYTWGQLGHPQEGRVAGSYPPASASAPAGSAPAASSSPAPVPAAKSGDPVVLGRPRAPGPVLPVSGARNILITSALPYVNNVPHLGNIIGCVLSADVYARFCRLRAHNVLYVCGTDEYGTATETKAIEEGLTPQQICDKYHAVHAEIYSWFGIEFDKFGRTTTPQQTQIAQEIFLQLEANGFSAEQEVEQQYCEKCERFLADRFVEGTCPDPACAYGDARGDQCDKCGKLVNAVELVKPKCKLCGTTPVRRMSKHLFLDLQQLQPELTAWVDRQKVAGGWSENAITITDAWLKLGLKPRSITRDLKWGTPVPKKGYENKVFYVWYDAPIGYISITANYTAEWTKWWKNPEVELVQFMGKDNIPFHAVMFPSTLMGADKRYTLVHHISCTEYLNYESAKFSKSRGTGVFGDGARDSGIPAEIWRYYMLSNRPEAADTTFLWEDFQNKNNAELLNNLGNFVQRTLSFVCSKLGGVVPAPTLTAADHAFIAEVSALKQEFIRVLEKVQLKDGLRAVMALSKKSNQFLQDSKPWELIKTDVARAHTVLFLSVNLISTLAVLIDPFMPSISRAMSAQLNQRVELLGALDAADARAGEFTLNIPPGHVLGTPATLFRRIEDDEIAALRLKFGGAPAQKKAGEPFPLQLLLGKVLSAREHEGAPHLFVLDFLTNEPVTETLKLQNPGRRQIVAGLRPHYEPASLVGRTFALLANLKPSNFKGVRSEGMLLLATVGAKQGLLTVHADDAAKAQGKEGAPVVPEDCLPAYKPNYDVKKELKKLDLVTRGADSVVHFGSAPLLVDLGDGQTARIVGDNNVGEGAKLQ